MKRYSLFDFSNEMKKIDNKFDVNDNTLLLPNYNISPGTKVPIIVFNSKNNNYEIIAKSSWGYKSKTYAYVNFKSNKGLYPRIIKKKIKRNNKETLKHLNFTIESIKDSTNLKKLYKSKKSRCIIPASSYFKWISIFKKFKNKVDDHEGTYEKIPLRFYNTKNKIFFYIGFSYTSETKENCHSVITRKSNGKFKKITNSLPISLDFVKAKEWLLCNDPYKKILEYDKDFNDDLIFHKVSKSVNKITYNNKKVLKKI